MEPAIAIFGTLPERALDAKEHHSLSTQYTPHRYIERLLLAVIEPLC